MATYYPSFSNQKDNLSTNCVGEHKPISYHGASSDPDNSTTYPNQASSMGEFSEMLSGTSLSIQNCVQIPTMDGRNEMSFIPPSSDALQSVDGQLNITTSNSICNPVAGNQNSQSQGLSLSLSSQMPSDVSLPSLQYTYQAYSSFFSGHLPFSGKARIPCTGDESKISKELKTSNDLQCGYHGDNNDAFEANALSNLQGSINHKQMCSEIYQFQPGFASTNLNSKYLKVAQELLNEVINVQQALKQPHLDKNASSQPKSSNGMSSEPSKSINTSSELSTAERQDLQNKKTKLFSMLDEVDRRYRQYYHQMKIVVSSFDVVAGCGAAKPYTALALQTISRHFRCLRDAISGQIQLTQKSLGENDNSSNNQVAAIPRLRYVDHQLRQQRALQQLGVMRNAWRPQRGLPESSVSVLRAWLFEHFLHPYPKDSEKIMLAKQTGLTRNQVANWFINARVRLWKPMIEEMYKEEFGEMDSNFKSSLENAAKAMGKNSSASEDRGEESQESMTSKVACADNVQPGQVQHSKPEHIPNVELNMPISRSMFQNIAIGNTGSSSGMKLNVDQMGNMESNNPYPDTVIPSGQHGHGTLMAGDAMYDLTELSGFTTGSQVSLALGLRNHENNAFPMSGETDMRGNHRVASSAGPETVDFHFMEAGNQQDRALSCLGCNCAKLSTHYPFQLCQPLLQVPCLMLSNLHIRFLMLVTWWNGDLSLFSDTLVDSVTHHSLIWDSTPNPTSSMLHHFIVSDSVTSQNQLLGQQFDAYGSSLRGNHNAFPQSLGLFPSIQSLGERMSRSMDLLPSPIATEESEISQTRHLMDLLGAANESNSNHQTQRLSLSLGSHRLGSSLNSNFASSSYFLSGAEAVSDDYPFTGHTFASSSTTLHRPYGAESFANAIANSRYLRPTQSLLDELVNVGCKNVEENLFGKSYLGDIAGGSRLSSELKAEFCSNEIALPEKHELQIRLSKLIGLLEEVEVRYEKYYQQMEDVVSLFESLAGIGAARSYTTLALQTMFKHFSNLRDAIISQINVIRRKLSHDLPRINRALSQLSLFDQDSRRNRLSLQQFGMIPSQRQTWRPIRGLPETSVAILRSWLFEHFLHPYPTDSEKLMLASQTGLTKNQVSNWFINARVRLWKPMIEEMYKEEFAESQQDSDPSVASSSMRREGVTDQTQD
ncbi:hypothetical protein V6N12_035378 [Hibiscus sabdariffa]